MTLQSTINDSAYYNSEEDDSESDPNINPKVPTHTSDRKKIKVIDIDTTNGSSPHKSLINRLIPDNIPFIIPTIDPMTADGAATIGGNLHAHRTILSKEIATDVAQSAARIFKNPLVVNWKATDGNIPRDKKTVGTPPILTTPVWIGAGPSFSPTSIRIQDIGSPRGSIGPQEVRNAQPVNTSINGISAEHRDPAPTWSKLIGRKFSN